MSYVVSIRRADGNPITFAETATAVAGDVRFEVDGSAQSLSWRSADGTQVWLMVEGGAIHVTTPPDDALRMMQALAVSLGARVYGEEGEDLTAVDVPDLHGKTGCLWPVVVLLGCAGVLLWFMTR